MMRSVTRCSACRHLMLDAVTVITGLSTRALLSYPARPSISISRTHSSRTFTSSRSLLESPSSNSTQETPQQTPQDEDVSKSSMAIPTTVPWYLQVQTPEPPAPISRMQAIEDIPPIPPDAPEILHPILTHLSTQTGLDNLTLLDLRSVYPPPALGSNLLMVLGTARSYKHLNTSADRFCRWLRSKYKLVPYADGLLGRNELKLKLRRKARRMKLAQSVGNTVAMGAVEGGDDGITTGWVCVNVGPVDAVKLEEADADHAGEGPRMSRRAQEELGQDEEEYKNPPDDSGVIGFGTQDTRPRIVVQMFLEEKRVEMDLEGLWDFRAQRREKKEEKLDHTGMAVES